MARSTNPQKPPDPFLAACQALWRKLSSLRVHATFPFRGLLCLDKRGTSEINVLPRPRPSLCAIKEPPFPWLPASHSTAEAPNLPWGDNEPAPPSSTARIMKCGGSTSLSLSAVTGGVLLWSRGVDSGPAFSLRRRTTAHGSWTTPPRIRSRRSVLKQARTGQYCNDMGQKWKRTSGECKRFPREAVRQIPTFLSRTPIGPLPGIGSNVKPSGPPGKHAENH